MIYPIFCRLNWKARSLNIRCRTWDDFGAKFWAVEKNAKNLEDFLAILLEFFFRCCSQKLVLEIISCTHFDKWILQLEVLLWLFLMMFLNYNWKLVKSYGFSTFNLFLANPFFRENSHNYECLSGRESLHLVLHCKIYIVVKIIIRKKTELNLVAVSYYQTFTAVSSFKILTLNTMVVKFIYKDWIISALLLKDE